MRLPVLAGPVRLAVLSVPVRFEQTYHHQLTKTAKSLVPRKFNLLKCVPVKLQAAGEELHWRAFCQSDLHGIFIIGLCQLMMKHYTLYGVGTTFTCIQMNNLCRSKVKGMYLQPVEWLNWPVQ